MSDAELEALRSAWAALPPNPPGPDCAAPNDIWEAVGGQRPESAVRAMLAHSLTCADCSALWRLARELRSASPEEPAIAPAGVTRLLARRTLRWVLGGGALAAAAIVALVVVPRLSERESTTVVRGSAGSALVSDPASSVLDRGHPVLRWSGAPEGSRYTVVVSTRDLTVLFRRSGLSAPVLEVPAEALSSVPAGGEIVWRVEAIAPGGRHLSSEAFSSRVP